jgi:hypothetical protein
MQFWCVFIIVVPQQPQPQQQQQQQQQHSILDSLLFFFGCLSSVLLLFQFWRFCFVLFFFFAFFAHLVADCSVMVAFLPTCLLASFFCWVCLSFCMDSSFGVDRFFLGFFVCDLLV